MTTRILLAPIKVSVGLVKLELRIVRGVARLAFELGRESARGQSRGDGAAAEAAPEPTPSARGLSATQALALFARLGVLARIQGSGFVVAQDPPAGTPILPGAIHTLFLADPGTAPAGRTGRRMEETAPPPSAP